MNFITTLYFLLLVVHPIALEKSEELQSFEEEVEKARLELEELKNAINVQEDQLNKQKRSVENLLASFEDADEDIEKDGMDKWLHSLSHTKNRLQSNLMPIDQNLQDEESDVEHDVDDPLKEWECNDDIGFQNNYGDDPKIDKHSVDILQSPEYEEKLGENIYDDYSEVEQGGEACKNKHSNDQYNMNKNDFSHEANYKLSKLEQDVAEKRKIPSFPDKIWKHNNVLTPKRSSGFNPMDEIKLKTSTRLISHGYGASLPSSSISEVRRENLVDDLIKKIERKWDDGISLIRQKDESSNINETNLDNYNLFSASPSSFNFRRKRLNSKNHYANFGIQLRPLNSGYSRNTYNEINENDYSGPSFNTKNFHQSANDNSYNRIGNNDGFEDNELLTGVQNNNYFSQENFVKNPNVHGFEEQLNQDNKLETEPEKIQNDLSPSSFNENNNKNEDFNPSKFLESYKTSNNDFIAVQTRGARSNSRTGKSIDEEVNPNNCAKNTLDVENFLGALDEQKLDSDKVLDINRYPLENTHNFPLTDLEKKVGAQDLNEFDPQEDDLKKAFARLALDRVLIDKKKSDAKKRFSDLNKKKPLILEMYNDEKPSAFQEEKDEVNWNPKETNFGETNLDNQSDDNKNKRQSSSSDSEVDDEYDIDAADNDLKKYYEVGDLESLDENDEEELNSEPDNVEYDLSNSISSNNNDRLEVIKKAANRLAAFIERTNRKIEDTNKNKDISNKATNQLNRLKREALGNYIENSETNFKGLMDDHEIGNVKRSVDLKDNYDKKETGKAQRDVKLIIPMRSYYPNPSQYIDQNEKAVNFNNLWFGENTNIPKKIQENFNEFGVNDMYSTNSSFIVPNAYNFNFKPFLPHPNNYYLKPQEKLTSNEEKPLYQFSPNLQYQDENSLPHYPNPGYSQNRDNSMQECRQSFEPPIPKQTPSSHTCNNGQSQSSGIKNSILNNNLRMLEQKVQNYNKQFNKNGICNLPNKGCTPEIIRGEANTDNEFDAENSPVEDNASEQDNLLVQLKSQIINCDSLENVQQVLSNLPNKAREEISNSKRYENRLQRGTDTSSYKANLRGSDKNMQPELSDDRRRRGAGLTKGNREIRSGDCEESVENPLSNLINGKLSSQVVQSVMNLVKDSPKFNVLWPALKQNHVVRDQRFKNFYAVRNCRNEPVVQRAEDMVIRAMKSINDIVDQQARNRACVPLRPDLAGFYELILSTYQDMDTERKRRDTASNLTRDVNKDISDLDANTIEERSQNVRKLLKQFEDLSREEQQQVSGLRDDLLKDLMYLRKLNEQYNENERTKREKLLEEHDEAQRLIENLEPNGVSVSPEYLKLVKTAELLREVQSEE